MAMYRSKTWSGKVKLGSFSAKEMYSVKWPITSLMMTLNSCNSAELTEAETLEAAIAAARKRATLL